MSILFALCAVGVIGCLGMTWLFPMVARALWRVSNSSRSGSMREPEAIVRSIAILIPAHNEEYLLPRSLSGVRAAIDRARVSFPQIEARVIVGADGCSDGTAAAALAAEVEVLDSKECLGKWRMLNRLVACAPDCEWIVFSDCGAAWPEDLLVEALARMRDPRVMAVAPSYGNPEGGALERVHWAIERHFKSLESSAGGPVSIHGATVMYRAAELRAVLAELEGRSWLNDDVVVPMLLRARNPGKIIHYAADIRVSDLEKPARICHAPREIVRRRRMVIGNVQWVREILPSLWRENRIAALVAMRRFFRIFWAYWLGLASLGGLAILASSSAMVSIAIFAASVIVTAALVYRLIGPIRRLLDSAFASLVAPYYCFASAFRIEGAVWK